MESSCVSPRSVTLLTASVEKRARSRTHARTRTIPHAQVGQLNVRIHSVTLACVAIQSSFPQRLKPFVNRIINNVAAPSSC